MVIENAGPSIEGRCIDHIKVVLEAKVPSSYREFLLRYNGGAPIPDTIDLPDAPGTPMDVQVFFGIGRSVASTNLPWNLALISERCPGHKVLPIACDSGSNLFCLMVNDGHVEQVVYCDLHLPQVEFYSVAGTFK